MKNHYLLYFTVCVLFAAFFTPKESFGQTSLVKLWDKRFGGTNSDALNSFQQTADGGYILGGTTFSGIGGDKTQATFGNSFDYWVVKTDAYGTKQWDKDFGGTGDDYLYSLQQTADGGYIIGGTSNSGINGNKTQNTWGASDYWIVKLDSLGNKLWDKDFGGTSSDYLYSLLQTDDGGYLLAGYSYSDSSGDKSQNSWGSFDYWIVKIDASGSKLWDKDFGGTASEMLFSVAKTNDEGYILGGVSNSDSSGDKSQNSQGLEDYWMVKIDSLGTTQWDIDFGGLVTEYLISIQQTADGGYILGGTSYSDSSGDKTQNTWGVSYDYWIVKTDSAGNKEWDKDFGGTSDEDLFGNIMQTSEGGYLIAGSSYSNISGDKTQNNIGGEQTWIVKTDSIGNKQWDKTILTTGHDEQGLVTETTEGCIVIANYTDAGVGGDKTQGTRGIYDYWIIKFCDSTLTTNISDFGLKISDLKITPNPSSDEFTISSGQLTINKIEIFNVLGETVFTEKPEIRNPKLETQLPKGIYIIKAYTDKGILQQKLIINHAP